MGEQTGTSSDIHEGMTVHELLRRYPEARSVLEKYWLRGSGGPIPQTVTLEFFAGSHRVAPEVLLADLREHLRTARRGA